VAPEVSSLTHITETETLLLRAALPTAEAATAWRAWRVRVRLDDVDSSGYRLLPQVYRTLAQEEVETVDRPRLKGVYRKAWVENQLWRRSLAQVLPSLRDEGVLALVPGGVAVAQRWYPDASTRDCDDHELLISPAQFPVACQVLRRLDWRLIDGTAATSQGTIPRPTRWQAPDGAHLDLRTFLLRETQHQEGERGWWPLAEAFALDGAEASGLGTADQLLCLCVEGCRGNAPNRLRWAVDAWHVLTHANRSGFDWDQFVTTARSLCVSQPVLAALVFLERLLRAPVPAGPMERLRKVPVTDREAKFFRLNAAPRGRWGELPVWLADYARQVEQGRFRGPLGLVRFLREARGFGAIGAAAGRIAGPPQR
jgi:hypothetical protein